jgi:hypothetical protein
VEFETQPAEFVCVVIREQQMRGKYAGFDRIHRADLLAEGCSWPAAPFRVFAVRFNLFITLPRN